MRTIKLLTIILVSVAMYSCNNSDETAAYTSDAYIIVKEVEGDTLFSMEAMVSSNSPMQKATLTKGSTSYEMEPFDSSKFSYVLITSDESFMQEPPEAGLYQFEIEHTDGTTAQQVDDILELYINPISFDTIEFDDEDQMLKVDWVKNDDITYFRIFIEKDGEKIFDSNLFQRTSYSGVDIPLNFSGWDNDFFPVESDSLYFQIYGYMFEPDKADPFQIQSISISNKYLMVWPE